MTQSLTCTALLTAFTLLGGSAAHAQDFYITDCSLGCSSSGPGSQISCSTVNVHENEIFEIGFSLPIDPASLSVSTIRAIDVNNGTSASLNMRVSPIDPTRLILEPEIIFTGTFFQFTMRQDRTYELFSPGVNQGDSGPYITSTTGRPNLGRFQCAVYTSEGVLPPARPECVTTPNSVGPGAEMSATGTTSVFLNDLVLHVTGLPSQSFGVLVVAQDAVYQPLGAGSLCVNGMLTRQGISQSNAAGELTWPLDLGGFGSGLVIAPGDTWRFQHIYRDTSPGGAVFTTSDAIRATFGI